MALFLSVSCFCYAASVHGYWLFACRPGGILPQSVSSNNSAESLRTHTRHPPAPPEGGPAGWRQQVPGTLAEGTAAAAAKPGQWLRQAQASSAAAAEKWQHWGVGLSGKIASRAATYKLQLWQPVQTMTVATVAAAQEHVPWLQQRLQLWRGWKDLGAASNPPSHIPQQQQPSTLPQQQLQHGHADTGGPAAAKPATSQQQQKQQQQQQQHEADERREAQALVARELQQLLQQQQEQLAADDQEEAEAMRKSLQELQSRVQRLQQRRAATVTATHPADTTAVPSQLQATPSAEHGTHHGHYHLQQQQQEEVTGTAGAAGRQQQQHHMAWSEPPQQQQQQGGGGGGGGGGDSLHLPASRLVDVLNDLLEANRLTLQAADHEDHGDMQELLQRFRADMQRWQQATAAAAAATGDELQRTEGGDSELQGQPSQQQEQEPQQEQELPSGQQVQHVVYTASPAADADAAGEGAELPPAPVPVPMLDEELQALAGALGLDKDPVRLQQILMDQHQDHLQLQRWPGPGDSDDYVVTVPYEVMVHDYDDYVVQMNEQEQPAADQEDMQGAQEQPAGEQQELELQAQSAPASAAAAGEADAVLLQQQQQTPGSAELVEGGAEPEEQQVRPQQPAATDSTHTEQYEPLPPGYYDYYADLHPPAPHQHQQQQGHKLWAGDAGPVPAGSAGISGAAVAETQQQQQQQGQGQGQEQPWSQQQQEQYEAMDLYYDNEDQPWLPDSPLNQQQQQQQWDEKQEAGSASDPAAAADSTEQQQRHNEEAEGQQQGLNVVYDDVEQQLHSVEAAVEDPSLDAQQQPQQQLSRDVQQTTVGPGDGGEEHLLHAEGDEEEQQQQQQQQALSEEGVAPEALPGQWTDPEAAHREASAPAAGDDVDTAAAAAGGVDGVGTDADADALAQLLAAMQAAGTDAAADNSSSSSSGEDASAAIEQPQPAAAASGGHHGSMPSLVQPGPTADSAQPSSDSDSQPEQQQATGSLLQGPPAGATGQAATAGAGAGSKPAPRLTKGTAALAAAAGGVTVCALACLLVLVMSARQGAVAAMGFATPFQQQRRRQPDIDASEEADGGGYAWDSQGAGGYDPDGEIQPADGVYYDGLNGYGPGGGAAGLGGDNSGWSDEDDTSFGPSDVSDIEDDDSQFSYDLSEGPLEDEEVGDEADGAAGRDSSFAGFAPIPGAAATAAAAAAAGASAAAAAAVGAAGQYALRPRRVVGPDGAVDFLWLRPNKFIPRRSQSNIGPDGTAGGSVGGASGGGITQRWLRNRVVTSIGGAAAQNPEVMDLVHSSAAVAYSSPPQPQQQRRLSSGALMASPGQQQQAAGQQYAERRPPSAGSRGDRGQPGSAAGGTPGGRGVPGLQLASVAAMLRGGGGYGSSPGSAGRAEGAVGMGQKSPRRLRDDRADVVLED